MAKKKLPISLFEIVWYIICALVIIWGLTYVVLSLINKYNDLTNLDKFAVSFKKTFGLSLYFWGLIIMAIGAVSGVVVMIIFAKTYDKAMDREQRRSARLNALKKEDDKVVAEQEPEVANEPAPAVEEKPVEQSVEEPKQEEPQEQPVEEPAQDDLRGDVPAEPAPEEAPEEAPAEEVKEETAE